MSKVEKAFGVRVITDVIDVLQAPVFLRQTNLIGCMACANMPSILMAKFLTSAETKNVLEKARAAMAVGVECVYKLARLRRPKP